MSKCLLLCVTRPGLSKVNLEPQINIHAFNKYMILLGSRLQKYGACVHVMCICIYKHDIYICIWYISIHVLLEHLMYGYKWKHVERHTRIFILYLADECERVIISPVHSTVQVRTVHVKGRAIDELQTHAVWWPTGKYSYVNVRTFIVIYMSVCISCICVPYFD